jgi:ATP-dependent DNA helicase RecG
MEAAELLAILARGEDSRHQFKRDMTNADSVAAELAAFANSGGGQLFVGVNDNGTIAGLSAEDVHRLNQLVSNAASNNVRPPLHPVTDNVQTDQGLVMVVMVPDGISKPYVDNQGRIWVKNGSDKRHVTAREELQRLFQQSGLVYADVVPVSGATAADIDEKAFETYFNRRYGQTSEYSGQPLPQLLQNLGLANATELNLAGLLLFGKQPQRFRPAFEVKAVAFPGTELHDTRYLDSEDIGGTLLEQYQRSFAFIKRNLRHVQRGRGFNTLGELEIPEQAIEELLVNALIHRDYFTSASIRLMVFADRVEIISPGHLPDALSTDAIRRGTSNRRNPTLTEHAVHILPYRGLGTGIPRALHDWPTTELVDDPAGNQFKAVLRRPAPTAGTAGATPEVTPEVAPEVTPGVTGEVRRLLSVMDGEMKRSEIQQALELKDEKHFREAYLKPALLAGLIEMTVPDKPNSRLQRYRLTVRGAAIANQQDPGTAAP